LPKKGGCGCSPALIILAVVLVGGLVIGFLAGPIGKAILPGLHLPSWLSVPQPKPELAAETVGHIGSFPITNTLVAAWVTIAFLVITSWAITRRMKLIPGRLQAVFEFIIGWVYDLCLSVAGDKNGRRFFPVVTTIFLFVAFNAWLGLLLPGMGWITVHTGEHVVPLLRPANTDINLPLALALTSFGFFWYFGLKEMPKPFLKTFFNFGGFFKGMKQLFSGKVKQSILPIFTGFINIFTGFLELVSVLIRVVSLTFRLFGNMTAGEILVLVMMFLLPIMSVAGTAVSVLELLIGFIQAIIFGGLTLIFLTLALEHHEEEEA